MSERGKMVFPEWSITFAGEEEVLRSMESGEWIIGIDVGQGPDTCVEGYRLDDGTIIITDSYQLPY